ncbi:hypothetical protein ACU5AX_12155 [Sphingomonas sp. XXL09]|uniref:hypothetical protein n=1 Tax=Sphingomonas sp. XXL09 TaxID=3457787 RepID=UPI00406BD9C8
MAILISHQVAEVWRAPLPFILLLVASCGVIWRVLKWRYDGIIEGYEHRLKLRDDTIARYEKGGTLASDGDISAPSKTAPSLEAEVPMQETASSRGDTNFGVIFASSTVSTTDLMKIYADHTSIQADKLAAIYRGKWMRLRGRVSSVYALSGQKTGAILHERPDDARNLSSISLTFNQDREFLETLKEGDALYAIGRIEKIGQFEVRFVECKIVKAE